MKKQLHRILDKNIQAIQISSRHEDLLAQTTDIESLESVLEVMTSRIASLKELINRISLRITEPLILNTGFSKFDFVPFFGFQTWQFLQ